MAFVSHAHAAQAVGVVRQSVSLSPWELIVIQDVLDGIDRVIQLSLIKFGLTPFVRKFTELLFRMVQPVAIGIREVPYAVGMLQIFMDAVDQRGDITPTYTDSLDRIALCSVIRMSRAPQRGTAVTYSVAQTLPSSESSSLANADLDGL